MSVSLVIMIGLLGKNDYVILECPEIKFKKYFLQLSSEYSLKGNAENNLIQILYSERQCIHYKLLELYRLHNFLLRIISEFFVDKFFKQRIFCAVGEKERDGA